VRYAPTPDDAHDRHGGLRWYRYPVAWLGVLVLAASLAGTLALIVIAERYPDASMPLRGNRILKAPIEQPRGDPEAGSSSSAAPSSGR
jgi:hypothetical protein